MSGGAAMMVAALLAGEAAVGLPASPCAALPEKGPVAQPAGAVVPAEPTAARGWHCPDDYALDLSGRMPVCRGGVAATPGNPRARCLALLPLGPMTPLPERSRPTATCPSRSLATVLALRGPGLGWAETAVTVTPASDVQLIVLADNGARVPPGDNPVVRGCFAPDCRLVRLAVGPGAADRLTITAALPGGATTSTELRLRPWCPRPPG